MNNPIWTNKMIPTWQPNPISINWAELIFRVTIGWVGLDWRFFRSVSQVGLKNTRTQPNSYTPLYTIAFMKRKILYKRPIISDNACILCIIATKLVEERL